MSTRTGLSGRETLGRTQPLVNHRLHVLAGAAGEDEEFHARYWGCLWPAGGGVWRGFRRRPPWAYMYFRCPAQKSWAQTAIKLIANWTNMPGRQGRHECHCAAQNKACLIKLIFRPVGRGQALTQAACGLACRCVSRGRRHRWVTIDIGQLHGMQAPGLKAALLKEA